jgi:spore maturation protein CgeB
MFLIQRDGYPERVQAAGAGSAIYLPTGCDPLVHCPLGLTDEEKQRWGSDISFVGAGYNNRQQVFATLAQRDFKIWGTEWPQMMPFSRLVQEKGRRVDPSEYVKIFNASAINLNLHSSMERDGVEPNGDFVNPRTFELAAAGAFQLVDERTLLPEKFEIGNEMITFANRVELEQKIDYYLAHPEERKAIAERSRKRALTEHTYVHRVQEMLSHIYSERYDQLKSRLQRGPWQETLRAAEPYPELASRFKRVFERGDEPKLDSLVADIQLGKGSLTETEQKLLFLHHVKKQIVYINELRAGKST